MWRLARPEDDEAVVEMCLELYREDPGFARISTKHIRATLAKLRREPSRGLAVVLELNEQIVGYALLMSFWSNELGGETCEVDELFIAPERRKEGHGTSLFRAIADGALFSAPVCAITLGITLSNARARRFYERLGFRRQGR